MRKHLLITLLLLLVSTSVIAKSNYSVYSYIPKNAYKYLPVVKEEGERLNSPLKPWTVSGLIEQESCISLRHRRCWSPTSELRTSREHGVGLGQLTRVWRRNGSLRFDKLTEMVKKHQRELKELTWRNVKSRPDLQIRAIDLMVIDLWRKIKNTKTDLDRTYMVLSAYNGGLGGNIRERRACMLKKWCDHRVWLNNVYKMTNAKSTRATRYFKRGYWQINREHGINIIQKRQNKYKKYYQSQLPNDTDAKDIKPIPTKPIKPKINKPKPKDYDNLDSNYWDTIIKWFNKNY